MSFFTSSSGLAKKKVLPASIDRSGFKAKQVPSFPIPVIREAIINAIAHRDYAIEGAKIQLGMDTFKSMRQKYALPLPIVDYDGSNVVVTFPRATEAIKVVSSRKGIKNLNDEEL